MEAPLSTRVFNLDAYLLFGPFLHLRRKYRGMLFKIAASSPERSSGSRANELVRRPGEIERAWVGRVGFELRRDRFATAFGAHAFDSGDSEPSPRILDMAFDPPWEKGVLYLIPFKFGACGIRIHMPWNHSTPGIKQLLSLKMQGNEPTKQSGSILLCSRVRGNDSTTDLLMQRSALSAPTQIRAQASSSAGYKSANLRLDLKILIILHSTRLNVSIIVFLLQRMLLPIVAMDSRRSIQAENIVNGRRDMPP
ncbi:hypothetical protein FNV43_RR16940 [Rhamnella rubrinervis]|uniref:Uncharacterized protein n=1 Tax=Rhamnella rubrinervis TaxID=2594499 RepID=A0A8K0GZR0_9ROSA|nr:hypothetical protein FNV43_RR16940 [Rhamnella rubrinervis]